MRCGSIKLRILIMLVVSVLLSALVTPVRAQALLDNDANGHRNNLTYTAVVGGANVTYTVTLTLAAGAPVALPIPAAAAPVMAHLAADFPAPGWTFTPAAAALPGNLRIIRYDAALVYDINGNHRIDTNERGCTDPANPLQRLIYSYGPDGNVGGGDDIEPFFTVQYTNPAGLPLAAGHRLQWIQYLTTTWPISGPNGTGPADNRTPGNKFPHTVLAEDLPLPTPPRSYIDPYDYDHSLCDGRPFYLTEAERADATNFNAAGNVVSFTFTDAPWRGLATATPGNPTSWVADLYLVDWDGDDPRAPPLGNGANGDVIVYTGVRWGFTITAVAGGVVRAGPVWSCAGVAGDKFDGDDADQPVNATLSGVNATLGGVGGIVIPVDKFALLAPYIGLASTIIVATVAAAIYVKRVKSRKEKQ